MKNKKQLIIHIAKFKGFEENPVFRLIKNKNV